MHKKENKVYSVPPVFPLPWYPDQGAWQLSCPKRVLRKSPLLRVFQDWLLRENEIGNVSRQEAVSMIPALILDVKRHHRVLDMCAAPGSKTCQMLEALLSDESKEHPMGCVIANDANSKRAYMLVHQCKRLACPGFVATTHLGQLFPNIGARLSPRQYGGVFDRVLADVPCSGDGTMRKEPSVLKRWGTSCSLGLHPLQIQIAMKGIRMLKTGGEIVYSTCSMSPIENEAVVAAILRQSLGALELVDLRDRLPNLKRRPGLSTWKVFAPLDTNGKTFNDPEYVKNLVEYSSVEEAKRANDKACSRTSLFPPTAEEKKWMNLDRCMRFYPHLQDTGGFFVCLFRKKARLKYTNNGNDENPSGVYTKEEVEADNAKEAQLAIEREKEVKKKIEEGSKEEEATTKDVVKNAEAVKKAERARTSGSLLRVGGGDHPLPASFSFKEMRTLMTFEESVASYIDTRVPGRAYIRYATEAGAENLLNHLRSTQNGGITLSGTFCTVSLLTEEEKEDFWKRRDEGVALKAAEKRKKKERKQLTSSDEYCQISDEVYNDINQRFLLPDDFPREMLYRRRGPLEKPKQVYFVADAVKELCLETQNAEKYGKKHHLKLISAGVLAFEHRKVNGVKTYRIPQEGLSIMMKYLQNSPRLIEMCLKDFLYVLSNTCKQLDFDSVSPEVTKKLIALSSGGFAIKLKTDNLPSPTKEILGQAGMYFCCWKGSSTFSTMVKKENAVALKAALDYTDVVEEKLLLPKREDIEIATKEQDKLEKVGVDESEKMRDEEEEVVAKKKVKTK
eukprot:g5555.t1